MLKIDKIKQYPEDEELLDDVIIENKQAIEMADIYSNILSGTMDAYASVISNNLNIVMKVLAIITIVMSIPTMIAVKIKSAILFKRYRPMICPMKMSKIGSTI